MAPYEPEKDTSEAGELRAGRRKAARYAVPIAVAGVAAATIGLVPALATSGDPDLPKVTAQELIEKIAESDTQQLSGNVKISTDLGLPSIGGMAGGFGGGGGADRGEDGDDKGSAADPKSKLMELASGTHTLRVAADGPDKQKVSVLGDASEYSVIHNGDDVWAYDSASNEAYHATEKAASSEKGSSTEKGTSTEKGSSTEKGDKGHEAGRGADVPSTPADFAEQALKAVDDTTSVKVDGTAQVAGRDAYRLVIKPKEAGSTVGQITIAVDEKTGTPLKFTLTPASGGAAVVDAGFTKVDFDKPSASTFDFTPPKGTKVTEGDEHGKEGRDFQDKGGKGGKEFDKGDLNEPKIIGEGWSTIAELKLPGGQGLPTAGSGDVPQDAQKLLDSLGDQVDGKFGSGTVFSTRLINALVTDDGTVYVGAVTKDALVKAANDAH